MVEVECVRCGRKIDLGGSHKCSKADLARAARQRRRTNRRDDDYRDDDEREDRTRAEPIGSRLARGFAMLDDDASLGEIYYDDELP